MNEPSTTSGHRSIRINLDQEILQNLISGEDQAKEQGPGYDRDASLREHQVYCLMRDMVSQFNARLKGRRERFKLVDEGEGLVIELAL